MRANNFVKGKVNRSIFLPNITNTTTIATNNNLTTTTKLLLINRNAENYSEIYLENVPLILTINFGV